MKETYNTTRIFIEESDVAEVIRRSDICFQWEDVFYVERYEGRAFENEGDITIVRMYANGESLCITQSYETISKLFSQYRQEKSNTNFYKNQN